MEKQNVWTGKPAKVTTGHTDAKGKVVQPGETVRVDDHTGKDNNFEVVRGDGTEVTVPSDKFEQQS